MRLVRSLLVIGLLQVQGTACDEGSSASPDTAGTPSDTLAPPADVPADTADTSPADTTPDADVVATVDPRCAAIIDGCLTRQRTCVIDAAKDEAVCRACPVGQFPARPDGVCTPLGGTRIAHDFGEQTIAPGDEIGSLCQSWVLDNDEEVWVNAVEMENDGAYHHSNWFFVPEDHMGWPTTPWTDCYSDGFHEIDAALAGGVLYAQSTQVRQELQKFQPGAAVRIPPRSRIITVTHLLNYHIEPVTTGLRLAIYTLPRADVTIPLTPAQLIYGALAIPPEARSWFGATCDLSTSYDRIFDGAPMAIKIHHVLPHYHDLGAGFDLSIVGGPRDGERIVDLGAYSSDPFGFAFDPPIDLTGATGLRFGCTFDNPRDEVVRWGIGDQEMCEALLFLESPMAFSAGVNATKTETTEGDVQVFSGDCGVAAFAFDPLD